MMTLATRFEEYVASHNLFTHDDRLLLTVSGGVDSMVMLSLFHEAGYRFGVAHCNFCLRGVEGDEDEMLVREAAERLGVPFYNQRFDTKGEMERTGESMEMAARRLRYQWFNQLCEEEGYAAIVVAHHADDSVETFFINLLRGTGLRGLTGISTQVGRVVRPLLFATRKEILEYAVAHRITYREDSSNRSTKYLRNKIRLGLVPRIREINPKFTALMRRNIGRLTDAQNFISVAIEHIRRQAVTEEGGVVRIHLDRIDRALPRGFVLYELLNSAYGFKGDVIDSLCQALERGESGRRFYAREWVACSDREAVVVAPITEEDPCEVTIRQGALRAYGGNSVLYFELRDIDLIEEFSVPSHQTLIDADKLTWPLTLRRWQEGDWFVPFGMTGKKKVSDLLVDQKVSVMEKQRQFVLLNGTGEIVWVVGRRADERFRLDAKSENVLCITREIV